MKEFWDERYGLNEFVYGETPNLFFKEVIDNYSPKGNILLPAEGEGRNAVYAAKNSLNVTCFDLSEQGKLKALKLAQAQNVTINYLVGNVSEMNFKTASFDVLAFIYAHFSPNLKEKYYKELVEKVKPGGLIIFEGFHKNQLEVNKENETSFGPQNEAMLFSVDELKSYFFDVEPLYLKEEIIQLNEGNFHKGKGAVIRFIGKKK